MLYITSFDNYEGFQLRFGFETHGNEVKSRRNKILLNHLKTPSLLRWCRENDDYYLLSIKDMATLKKKVLGYIRENGKTDPTLTEKVVLIGDAYYSSKYRTDEFNGLCEDYDKKSIRYINVERQQVFKMKAGKFFSSLIKETTLGQALNPSVINWLAEEFVIDWETYTYGQTPDVTLVVDDDFEKIYSTQYCKNFQGNSCMLDRGRYSFYEDAVKAKAASIIDGDGFVLARAVIYTNAVDQDGKTWRLLERQYSKESNEVLKRTLIDLLIKGDYIDAYKQVGAGCGESRAFVANDGTSLIDYKFSIDMKLETYSCLSYQDSFKYFDIRNHVAYNYEASDYDYTLDTTDYSLDDSDDDYDHYDDYHGYGCDHVTLCYVNGAEYYVDSDNMDEFCYVESLNEYHHKDDVELCPCCNKYVLADEANHSEVTDKYYCSKNCMEKEELKYKEKHWFYSEYDKEWYQDIDMLMHIKVWNQDEHRYVEQNIYEGTLAELEGQDDVYRYGDEYFNEINPSTNLPFGYFLIIKTNIENEYKSFKEAV